MLVCLFVCQEDYSKKLWMNVHEMFGWICLRTRKNRLDFGVMCVLIRSRTIITHADESCGSKALIRVCLSVCMCLSVCLSAA